MLSIPPDNGTISDEVVMQMIQARQSGGMDLIHERYGRLIKVVSMNLVHNDSDAEDLVQEILMEIWNHAAAYDPEKGRPLSWITTLTRRRSIDRLRKRATCGRGEERLAEESLGLCESWTHVHEDLAQRERSQHLLRAMATLPDAQRESIELAYEKQMTQREIAEHTGIPLGTIKTRLELGLKKMAVVLYGLEDLLFADYSGSGNIPDNNTVKRCSSAITSR